MKKIAMIISNPGESALDPKTWCEGVKKDVENYAAFLMSPIGGYWNIDEILCLDRRTVADVRGCLSRVRAYDFSLTVFCGHGFHSRDLGATVLELRKGQELDSTELRAGPPRQAVILDCCRVDGGGTLLNESVVRKAKLASSLNPEDCRKYYERRIRECDADLLVTHACSRGEKAYDDSQNGGHYSYNLIAAAETWARSSTVNTAENFATLSFAAAHALAAPKAQATSGNRQHPQIEKPRSGKDLPFCVVA